MYRGTLTLLAAVNIVVNGAYLATSKDLEFSSDLTSGVILQWNYDALRIRIKIVAPTAGWIGIGFSQTNSMNGADMILMGVTDGGPHALDTHAERNGVPLLDESQDVEVLAGWENGTHTSVTVARKRVTCDGDDMGIKEGTYRIIWAYGKIDLIGEVLSSKNYHGRNRGSRSIKLINPRNYGNTLGKSQEPEEELEYFDIRPSNFSVPAYDTHYYCQMFDVPNGPKRHIVKIAPIVTPGNEKFVHHINVFLCKDSELVKKPFTCYEDMSPTSLGCGKIIAAWAIGGSAVEFPKNVGFPFAGPEDMKNVLLQTHYDNPDEIEFVDSSGIRLHYTYNLRKYEAGILRVAQTIPGIWIPPKAEKFRVENYCSETCLAQGMEMSRVDEVTVFGAILHSHLAGRSLRLRHIRNGKELEPIAKDDFFDFNYQETQYIDDGKVKIRNGDSLMVQCDYGTAEREEMTIGGLGTLDEMCVAIVFYYPRINLDLCESVGMFLGNFNKSKELMEGLNMTISAKDFITILPRIAKNPVGLGNILKPYFNQVDWTPEKISFAESFLNSLPITQVCMLDAEWLMSLGELKDIPTFDEYDENDECRVQEPNSTLLQNAAYIFLASVLILIVAKSKIRFS